MQQMQRTDLECRLEGTKLDKPKFVCVCVCCVARAWPGGGGLKVVALVEMVICIVCICM